ncbi:hypothetical protein [Pedobacter faecalis]|uniref:hypothetical protein n=1 Tax=Pedobacter faecalis TaxID=3041495 RepID=UPI0025519FF9|nr:hypothetical protein [Pedobacter sp. ELA7]
MTVKEFLLATDDIKLASIAKKMYPTNVSADTYLNRKLKGTDGRPFTKKDAEKALTILKELSITINNLTVE